MIGCLRTRVHKQPIIALYFESENVLKLYNLEARNITRMFNSMAPYYAHISSGVTLVQTVSINYQQTTKVIS